MNDLRAEIASHLPELTAIRRDLHAHPEIGFEEVRTSALVARKLAEWGVATTPHVGKTGVVGTIHGNRPGSNTIGLRADLDALPIHEATGLPYASRIAGRMHACGHDGHTTMLLGAAHYLARHRDFAGTVNLIFQPAEEGVGGAMEMLQDGLFERFPCDAVYGLHNFPGHPLGNFSTREGPLMAASGRFETTFSGRGGHAGFAQDAKCDLVPVLAKYVQALSALAASESTAEIPAVIRVGEFEGHGGTSLNVMPSKIYVGGTLRCFDARVRDLFTGGVKELASTLAAEAEGASAETKVQWITTPLINAKKPTVSALKAAQSVVGASVDDRAEPITGAEDFAFMMEKRPGSFVFLGNGSAAEGPVHNLHTPKYDFNDRVIPYGVEYWVRLVQQELAN